MEPSINRTLTVSVVSYGVVSVVNGVINVDNQAPIEFPAVLDEASAAKLLKSRYGGKLFPVDANIVVSSIRHEKWKFSMDLSQFVATAARSRVDGTASEADDAPQRTSPPLNLLFPRLRRLPLLLLLSPCLWSLSLRRILRLLLPKRLLPPVVSLLRLPLLHLMLPPRKFPMVVTSISPLTSVATSVPAFRRLITDGCRERWTWMP